jgi:hypothetical protein
VSTVVEFPEDTAEHCTILGPLQISGRAPRRRVGAVLHLDPPLHFTDLRTAKFPFEQALLRINALSDGFQTLLTGFSFSSAFNLVRRTVPSSASELPLLHS